MQVNLVTTMQLFKFIYTDLTGASVLEYINSSTVVMKELNTVSENSLLFS